MIKIFLLLGIFLLTACNKVSSGVADSIKNRSWKIGTESPAERAYCSDSAPYSGGYSISGKALYEYRKLSYSGDPIGLVDIADDPEPIRHAQIEILNEKLETIQCGETDENGDFDLAFPFNPSKVYRLRVYSRSNNSFNRASVFRSPEKNDLYYLEHPFTANADQENIRLIAKAGSTTNLMGGAFYILEQIHLSFDRLKTLITSNGKGVAVYNIPKADIYWEKGFNPGLYINKNTGISFYDRVSSKMFILGGLNGEINFSDTDHFDNSIILHEYYHFLENNISQSFSPGGPHSGDEILDSFELAWSEGAGNFYQAAITDIPIYFDTTGNIEGSTFGVGWLAEIKGENDIPSSLENGAQREFVVTRVLWDLYDTPTVPEEYDTVENYFDDFWRTFANVTGKGFSTSLAGTYSPNGTVSCSVCSTLDNFLTFMLHNIVVCDGRNQPAWMDLLNEEKVNIPTSNGGSCT